MATALAVSCADFSGLKWVRTLWGFEPRWTVELDEKAIKQTAQSVLGIPDDCTVEFLAQGAFNKVYIVMSPEKEAVLRVSLPVDPTWKTLSEVATLRWVRDNTDLPVPEVLSYEASRLNRIGYEWIMMERMAGRPLADVWRAMSFSAKDTLVRQLASFCSDTFAKQFRGIGNIFPQPTKSVSVPSAKGENKKSTDVEYLGGSFTSSFNESSTAVQRDGTLSSFSRFYDCTGDASTSQRHSKGDCDVFERDINSGDGEISVHQSNTNSDSETAHPDFLGATTEVHDAKSPNVQRIVSTAFLLQHRINEVVPRGPFPSSKDWLSARLAIAENGCRQRLSYLQQRNESDLKQENTEDEGSGEDSEEECLTLEELERAMAIVARLKSRLAEFFPIKDVEPEPSMIVHDDLSFRNILVKENGTLSAVVDWECISALPLWSACQFPSFLEGKQSNQEPVKSQYEHDEDGEVDELYWEHLNDYECTQLRHVFLDEMRKLQPEWVKVFETSQAKRDFDLAIEGLDDEFTMRSIWNWLRDLDSGKESFPGLEERISDWSR